MIKPKKISVRPGNTLEGLGIVVWVYHRKVQMQLQFIDFPSVEECIQETVDAWRFAMEAL
jgi:hypothetical protein